MVTYKIELSSTPNQNGQHGVRLRITHNRKHKRISLGFAIAKKDVNPKGTLDKSNWIRATCPQYNLYNQRIRAEIEKAIRLVNEMTEEGLLSLEGLLDRMSNDKAKSFLEYYKLQLELIKGKVELQSFANYQGFFKRFTEYLEYKGKNDFLFNELTSNWLKEYHSFLLKKNAPGTVNCNFVFLKRIVNDAIKEKLIKYENNPFLGYNFVFSRAEKEKLTTEELEKIESIELDPDKRISHARDIFLFMYYTHGMRIGDALFIKVGDVFMVDEGYRLKYVMQKTKRPKNVLLNKRAVGLFLKYSKNKNPNDYLFPFVRKGVDYSNSAIRYREKASKVSVIDENLIKLGKKIGLTKKVSCHIARHTFADMARVKGATTYSISKALGHSKLSTTEQYLKGFDQNQVDSINEIYE